MSNIIKAVLLCAVVTMGTTEAARAQDLSALARVNVAGSEITDKGRGISVVLALSQPVPYRLRLLAEPPRLVADFREVNWEGVTAGDLLRGKRVLGLHAGALSPGWSRMVLELDGPFAVDSAQMQRDVESGRAMLELRLARVSPEEFASHIVTSEEALIGVTKVAPMPAPRRRQDGTRPVRVVLDPGHGGIDPGAERGGVKEADLMLTFARELKEALLRAGFDVVMTREEDAFVPLETRVSIARAAQADVFLSLHADVVAEGQATGAAIYTLSDKASDRASQKLAERHDRADLLAGVDLSDHDDVIADVLMDLARLETAPRADGLADALVVGLRQSIGRLHKRPRHEAGFSVLKAPDIPSVLLELGFLSSPEDLENLKNPDWRAKAAGGVRDALVAWAKSDAAQAALLRQ
ncbi:N-acetylmuramoyl-L-alanine amidase [Actibacterium lipolyticum]|uniref:N-acetylmuramoyl-L-alanine amidase n=1 Tax=Actibacterium lipolyticum TaxID=1524263 RepID=A0A238KJ85_9RHOB|nr:N-acetylmuramoyl-L-alanine amidase [Actibacterium lipolyticum]SMX42780.1 N-acetylmuramoyl-L-alanine amidase AmiA precursor [Actibacterium lipolyticum]